MSVCAFRQFSSLQWTAATTARYFANPQCGAASSPPTWSLMCHSRQPSGCSIPQIVAAAWTTHRFPRIGRLFFNGSMPHPCGGALELSLMATVLASLSPFGTDWPCAARSCIIVQELPDGKFQMDADLLHACAIPQPIVCQTLVVHSERPCCAKTPIASIALLSLLQRGWWTT